MMKRERAAAVSGLATGLSILALGLGAAIFVASGGVPGHGARPASAVTVKVQPPCCRALDDEGRAQLPPVLRESR